MQPLGPRSLCHRLSPARSRTAPVPPDSNRPEWLSIRPFGERMRTHGRSSDGANVIATHDYPLGAVGGVQCPTVCRRCARARTEYCRVRVSVVAFSSSRNRRLGHGRRRASASAWPAELGWWPAPARSGAASCSARCSMLAREAAIRRQGAAILPREAVLGRRQDDQTEICCSSAVMYPRTQTTIATPFSVR